MGLNSLNSYSAHNENSKLISGYLNINSNMLYFHSTEQNDYNLSIAMNGSYNSRNDMSEYSSDTGLIQKTGKIEDNYFVNISSIWNSYHYPTNEEIFLLLKLEGSYSKGYQKSSTEDKLYHQTLGKYINKDESHSVDFDGAIGVGYGRMRDGTFIFRALRVIEKFYKNGIIPVQLTKSQVLSITDRLAKKREYVTNYQRYKKYFVSDIIDDLVQLEIIRPEEITPFAVMQMSEALDENIYPRFFGWRIYYAFNDLHHQYQRDQKRYNSISHWITNEWVYIHEFGFEVGHPISLTTHLNINTELELPNHNYKTEFRFNVGTSISHEIGERINFIGSYNFSRGVGDRYSYWATYFSRSTIHNINANFLYYIEDQISLSTSTGWSKYTSQYYSKKFSTSKYSSLSISFGVDYNIF